MEHEATEMNNFLEEMITWAQSATHVPLEVRASMLSKVRRYVVAMGGNTKALIALSKELGFDEEYYGWCQD